MTLHMHIYSHRVLASSAAFQLGSPPTAFKFVNPTTFVVRLALVPVSYYHVSCPSCTP